MTELRSFAGQDDVVKLLTAAEEKVSEFNKTFYQSHLPTTTAWTFKISQANKHLWPLSMVQIKAF